MKFLFPILIIAVFHASALGQNEAHYKIRSEYCSTTNKCIVLAYVEPTRFDKANMQKLAGELTGKYKDKAIVNFNIFDDEKLIDAFLNGKRSPSQIHIDRRAYFLHNVDCGGLLFYKSEENKLKVIRLGWKNTKQCNKPFFI